MGFYVDVWQDKRAKKIIKKNKLRYIFGCENSESRYFLPLDQIQRYADNFLYSEIYLEMHEYAETTEPTDPDHVLIFEIKNEELYLKQLTEYLKQITDPEEQKYLHQLALDKTINDRGVYIITTKCTCCACPV